jgi:hypothetical protein
MITVQDVLDVFSTASSANSELLWCRGGGFVETLLAEADSNPDIWPELDFIGGL